MADEHSGHSFTVTFDPGFVGNIDLPITVTEGDLTTVVHALFTVGIDDPYDVFYGPAGPASTRVTWEGVDNAVGYRIYVGDVLVGSTGPSTFSFYIHSLLGPNAVVKVMAYGENEVVSNRVRATYVVGSRIVIASLRYATNSPWLSSSAKLTLRRLAAQDQRTPESHQ
jgi:hypothetical protein